jgi:hypothetical protein
MVKRNSPFINEYLNLIILAKVFKLGTKDEVHGSKGIFGYGRAPLNREVAPRVSGLTSRHSSDPTVI